MKIAIQGHPTRGKEVIQILKSLGGINNSLSKGTGDFWYFINSDNHIINDYKFVLTSAGFKTYTLEEFEKEFPFKIGDKIMDCSDDEVGIITDLLFIDNMLMYNVDFVNSGQAFMPTEQLKFHKEMKEERNITLTLDKAKEWYKKGRELKEIALQAFTEKELTKVELPKTWEEYIQQNFHREGYVLTHLGSIAETEITGLRGGENLCPSKKSAEAHLAMIQLEQLRDCWRQGWIQTPTDTGYRISKALTDGYIVLSVGTLEYFLAFPTEEMAKEFLECFKDLIEKAGDLI